MKQEILIIWLSEVDRTARVKPTKIETGRNKLFACGLRTHDLLGISKMATEPNHMHSAYPTSVVESLQHFVEV